MIPPSEQHLAKLAAAVRSRIGFDLHSVGDQSLLRGLIRHMTDQRIADGNDYVEKLLKDEAECDELVEELVVPETWFFRDRQPFRCVQDYAVRHWRAARLGDRLRVLSIPCSTGEEPYSIAMALFDVGLTPAQFQIDGADLSRRALHRAEEAVYGKSSFRGDEAALPGLCERFLERQGERFVASAQLRGTVRFFQANLVSPALAAGQPRYHVVFCRNVLIYMDTNARQVALANLHRLLLPDGLLYVGHVEARLAAGGPFRPFSREYPFAFSPIAPASASEGAPLAPPAASTFSFGTARADRVRTAALTPANSPLKPSARKRNNAVPAPVAPTISRTDSPAADPAATGRPSAGTTVAEKLAAARSAADAGRAEQAITLCRAVLDEQPTSADALCLMGLVSRACGRTTEAEAHFQKVLYLQPRHQEALIHMMLLALQRGDRKSAANFRRRVEQVQGEEVGS